MRGLSLAIILPLLASVCAIDFYQNGIKVNRKHNLATDTFNQLIGTNDWSKKIIESICSPYSAPAFHFNAQGTLKDKHASITMLKKIKVGHVLLVTEENSPPWIVKEFNIETNEGDLEYILREINIGLKVTSTLEAKGSGPVTNLVPVKNCLYDYYDNKKVLYVVYPYYSLGSIDKYLSDHHDDFSTISFKWKLEIMEKIASGINLMAESKFVHRDIKPENIMMAGDLQPVVIDFGLSKRFEEANGGFNTIAGTIRYIAPEVVSSDYGLKSDVFSLGLVFFEILNNFGFKETEKLRAEANSFCDTYPNNELLAKDWEKTTYCNVFKPLIKAMTKENPNERIDMAYVLESVRGAQNLAAQEDEKWFLALRKFPFINMLRMQQHNPENAKVHEQVLKWVHKNGFGLPKKNKDGKEQALAYRLV